MEVSWGNRLLVPFVVITSNTSWRLFFGMWNMHHGEIIISKILNPASTSSANNSKGSPFNYFSVSPWVSWLLIKDERCYCTSRWCRSLHEATPVFRGLLGLCRTTFAKVATSLVSSSPYDSSEVASSAEGREKHGALVEVIARAALDAQVFLPSPFRVFLPSSWRHQGRRRQHAPPLLHLVSCKNIEACQNHTEERVCGNWAHFWMIIVIKIAKPSSIQLICN